MRDPVWIPAFAGMTIVRGKSLSVVYKRMRVWLHLKNEV